MRKSGIVTKGNDEIMPLTWSENVLVNKETPLTEVLIEAPRRAEVGQILAVKAVDENGKPTEWETITNSASGTSVRVGSSGQKYDPTDGVVTIPAYPTSLPANGGTAANVSGTVAISHGGTGATTASSARTNLGLGGAATKSVDTSITMSTTSINLPTSAAVASAIKTELLSTIVASSNASASNTKTLDFQGTGKNLEKLVIKGKSVGDKTSNLLDVKKATFGDKSKVTINSATGYVTSNVTSDSRAFNYNNSEFTFTLNAGTYILKSEVMSNLTSNHQLGFYIMTSSRNLAVISYATSGTGTTERTFTLSSTTTVGFMAKGWSSTFRLSLRKSTDSGEYEPYGIYKIPISVAGKSSNIYLDAPLLDGDVLDTGTGIITRANGTKETFEAPEINTAVGKNTLTVGTGVTPTKVEATSFGEYYSKAQIDKMFADVQADLAAMAELL